MSTETSNQIPSNEDVKNSMLSRGWCIHQVNQLTEEYDHQTLKFISQQERKTSRMINHAACLNEQKCIANNVDMGHYRTRHVQDGCKCHIVSIDNERLIDIISKGGVPLVSVQLNQETGDVSLHVEPRTAKSRYTAVSHVWADGLGNPNANALPQCQLSKLRNVLRNLPEAMENSLSTLGPYQLDRKRLAFSTKEHGFGCLFWMDTLCIPVKSQHASLRAQSINDMASIYAAAINVVVLDSELQSETTKGTPASELLARILCCTWNTRSWTLQEGVLGMECLYQFEDGAINPIYEWCTNSPFVRIGVETEVVFPSQDQEDDIAIYLILFRSLWKKLHQDWKSSWPQRERDPQGCRLRERYSLGLPLRQRFSLGSRSTTRRRLPQRSSKQEQRHFAKMRGELYRAEQLVNTWNELSKRSTTMTEDIHVIAANLLNFSAHEVMTYNTPEERMEHMIFSFQSLPLSLLFNTSAPYSCRRNRWIPSLPSRELLTLSPLMYFVENLLALEVGKARDNILILQVSAELSDKTEEWAVQVAGTEDIYVVQPVYKSSQIRKVDCIILPRITSSPENDDICGACLSLSEAVSTVELSNRPQEIPADLQLSYQFPVRIVRKILHDSDGQSRHSNFCIGRSVPYHCKVFVEHGISYTRHTTPKRFSHV